ncbi:MAG: YgjV family protein [Clostridia bacterium]|nr:YgjV family protein [Clostridia bacterium]
MQPVEIVGQIISVIAVIITFVTYQMKSTRQIFIVNAVATGVSCIAYAMLGGITALGLNIMCIVRNLCYMHKDKNKHCAIILPALLSLIMAVLSAFLWEGYHSLFFVVGITLNTLAMGYFNPQNLRKSILLTSTLILIYNLFVPSIGGAINEVVAISSSAIGLVRHRQKKEVQPQ